MIFLNNYPYLNCVNVLYCSMGVSVSDTLVTSTLLISGCVPSDAAPYSCTSTVYNNKDFPRAVVMVHVLRGQEQLLGDIFLIFFLSTGDQLAVQGTAVSSYRSNRYGISLFALAISLGNAEALNH